MSWSFLFVIVLNILISSTNKIDQFVSSGKSFIYIGQIVSGPKTEP